MPPVCSLYCSRQDLDPSGVSLGHNPCPFPGPASPPGVAVPHPAYTCMLLAPHCVRAMERVTRISEPLHLAVPPSSSTLIFVYPYRFFLAQGHFLQESSQTLSKLRWVWASPTCSLSPQPLTPPSPSLELSLSLLSLATPTREMPPLAGPGCLQIQDVIKI